MTVRVQPHQHRQMDFSSARKQCGGCAGKAIVKPVFVDNPFLDASEQFMQAALTLFAAARADLHVSVSGEHRVRAQCYLLRPPSRVGHLTVEFSYDSGGMLRLGEFREAGDCLGAAAAASECLLHVQIDFHAYSPEAADAKIASALFDCLRGMYADDAAADVRVDVIRRWSPRAGLPRGHGMFLVATAEQWLTATEVHARDWGQMARRVHELGWVLESLASGKKQPAREQIPGCDV